MNYFEQIQAMHEQVRQFIEEQEPLFKVTTIDGFTMTQYQETLASRDQLVSNHIDFILTEVKVAFHVKAQDQLTRMLTCNVFVTTDGKLYLTNQSTR